MVDNILTVLNTDSGLSTARFNDNESHTLWITPEKNEEKDKTKQANTFLITLITNTKNICDKRIVIGDGHRQLKWIRTKAMIDKDKLAIAIVLIETKRSSSLSNEMNSNVCQHLTLRIDNRDHHQLINLSQNWLWLWIQHKLSLPACVHAHKRTPHFDVHQTRNILGPFNEAHV